MGSDMATPWEEYQLAQAAYLQNQSTVNLLSSTTLASAAASITFSAIPQTYASLMLVLAVKSASTVTGYTADNAVIQVNGVTTATYTACYIENASGTSSASFVTGATSSGVGNIWNSFSGNTLGTGGVAVFIPGYSQSTFRFNSVSFSYASDAGAAGQLMFSGGSNQTAAAITSVALKTGSGSNFVTGSYAALYGM